MKKNYYVYTQSKQIASTELQFRNAVVQQLESYAFVKQVVDYSCIYNDKLSLESDLDIIIILNDKKISKQKLNELKKYLNFLEKKYPSLISHKPSIISDQLWNEFLTLRISPYQNFYQRADLKKNYSTKNTEHAMLSFYEIAFMSYLKTVQLYTYPHEKEELNKQIEKCVHALNSVCEYLNRRKIKKIEMSDTYSNSERIQKLHNKLQEISIHINSKYQISPTKNHTLQSSYTGKLLFTHTPQRKFISNFSKILGKKFFKIISTDILSYFSELQKQPQDLDKNLQQRAQFIQKWSAFLSKNDLQDTAYYHLEILNKLYNKKK